MCAKLIDRGGSTKDDIAALHAKLDAVLESSATNRQIMLSDIRVPLVGIFLALLALGTPAGFVVANHYKVAEHIANTRVHLDEAKSMMFGGPAYAGDISAKERQVYFTIRAMNCGEEVVKENAERAICSSSFPDGPFPSLLAPGGKAPSKP